MEVSKVSMNLNGQNGELESVRDLGSLSVLTNVLTLQTLGSLFECLLQTCGLCLSTKPSIATGCIWTHGRTFVRGICALWVVFLGKGTWFFRFNPEEIKMVEESLWGVIVEALQVPWRVSRIYTRGFKLGSGVESIGYMHSSLGRVPSEISSLGRRA